MSLPFLEGGRRNDFDYREGNAFSERGTDLYCRGHADSEPHLHDETIRGGQDRPFAADLSAGCGIQEREEGHSAFNQDGAGGKYCIIS